MSPIRFFCPRCNLMMKIGASMLGKSVGCPDCGSRIEVPFQSDPRAEALYLRMKQHPHGQETPHSEFSAPSEQPAQQSFPKPQGRPDLPGQPTAPPPAERPHAVIEQVDEWIEKLWTDIPDSGVVLDAHRYHAPSPSVKKEPVVVKNTDFSISTTIRGLRNDPLALRWAVLLLAAVFLFGVGSGFVLRPLVVSGRNVSTGDARPVASVEGKLTFETPDERPLPDVDAVVIFLPIANIPIVPFSGRELRPQDGTEDGTDDPSGAIQQIEELGGRYVRADVQGKFSFSVDTAGRYLGILISSHAIRPPEAKWNAETDQQLRRFFREPSDLLGNYRFLCGEYDLNKGETLSVQFVFSRSFD